MFIAGSSGSTTGYRPATEGPKICFCRFIETDSITAHCTCPLLSHGGDGTVSAVAILSISIHPSSQHHTDQTRRHDHAKHKKRNVRSHELLRIHTADPAHRSALLLQYDEFAGASLSLFKAGNNPAVF